MRVLSLLLDRKTWWSAVVWSLVQLAVCCSLGCRKRQVVLRVVEWIRVVWAVLLLTQS